MTEIFVLSRLQRDVVRAHLVRDLSRSLGETFVAIRASGGMSGEPAEPVDVASAVDQAIQSLRLLQEIGATFDSETAAVPEDGVLVDTGGNQVVAPQCLPALGRLAAKELPEADDDLCGFWEDVVVFAEIAEQDFDGAIRTILER